ncbi:ABC transporter permease [Micromonospora sp. M12]
MLGARASLQVGLLAVATSLVIGVPLGLAAGYFRAWDAVISRFTDLLLAFPFLIMAVGWPPSGCQPRQRRGGHRDRPDPRVIRVVRSDTLRLKSLDFVAAAVVDGASDLWVLARHILPNATSVILVQATVAIPAAILGEAVLSFLGLGIQPRHPASAPCWPPPSSSPPARRGPPSSRCRDHGLGAGVQRLRRRPARRPRPEGDRR